MNKLGQLLRLPAASWWFLLQAWLCLLAVDLGLRCGARKRLQRRAAPRPEAERTTPDPERLARARHLARLVRGASRLHLHEVTCLPRALTLQWLLKRRGLDADLRFGVRATAPLDAHAWVELDGEALGEDEGVQARYQPMAPLSDR